MSTRESRRQAGKSTGATEPKKQLPPGTDAADEELLDEAISETFPASDPISPAVPTTPTVGAAGARSSDTPHEPHEPGGEMVQDDPHRFKFPTADRHPLSREEKIRIAAYLRFLARNGQDGSDLDDWYLAEAELDAAHDEASRKGH